MLAIDRHRRILELLNGSGSLRTVETAAELGVTDETVRKDFEFLEKRGDLIRTHGGAGRAERSRDELPLTERQTIRREEKRVIARLAAGRIRANETIFLDASSTTLTLTEFLPDLPLTILTNALDVFTALSDRPNLELICTGGSFDPRSRSFVGLTAEKALQRYNIHRMFFSGNGLDLERGISESQSQQAAFKERVIAYSEDVVFLADHSKLGQKSAFFFAPLKQVNCLVTDKTVNKSFLKELRKAGIEVLEGG
ncbi:MAG: DeoR/GlpR transcriptional regulator [Verrucomicrobiaceae bacterium]|nr:MAG: DeoR/GlpR transcriptional regulator [Verrucomicrobiaceae bacterium]